MKQISTRTAWHVFVGSLVLLAAIAYVGDLSAGRYASSEAWVSHTRQVEAHISDLRADMAVASLARYQASQDAGARARYEEASSQVEPEFNQLRALISDNPVQQANLQKLLPVIRERMSLIASSFPPPGASFSAEEPEEKQVAAGSTSILGDMQAEEERLLAQRTVISERNYLELRIVLGAGLLVSFILLTFVFRTLLIQLSMRATAERAVRKLSGHILRVQDVERRRVARELHDGIGQVFSALLMELQTALNVLKPDSFEGAHLASAQELAQRGLAETRTVSYLLHPPLLDEMGFEHAARWYVDGFTKRSNIEVTLKTSEPFKRLPETMELVLFRVIQESLTNVHRHSGSKRAEITVTSHPDRINLSIRDFGKGIPPQLLQGIEESSAGAGVGLGGMRERVSDLGGHFAIQSGPGGTTISVSLPLPTEQESFANGDPTGLAAVHTGRAGNSDSEDLGGLPMIAVN